MIDNRWSFFEVAQQHALLASDFIFPFLLFSFVCFQSFSTDMLILAGITSATMFLFHTCTDKHISGTYCYTETIIIIHWLHSSYLGTNFLPFLNPVLHYKELFNFSFFATCHLCNLSEINLFILKFLFLYNIFKICMK